MIYKKYSETIWYSAHYLMLKRKELFPLFILYGIYFMFEHSFLSEVVIITRQVGYPKSDFKKRKQEMVKVVSTISGQGAPF